LSSHTYKSILYLDIGTYILMAVVAKGKPVLASKRILRRAEKGSNY
jgi:hypothetical protein